jgi:hypothetical protein
MKLALSITAALVLLMCALVPAGVRAAEGTLFTFATVEEGRKVLAVRDTFIEQMSSFDRSCRMRTDRKVAEKEFLDFVSANVLSWEKDEEDRIRPIVASMEPKLKRFAPFLPETVYLVKTTGNEEGGVAYTRGNVIVIPARQIRSDVITLYRLISHELFHIMSRRNPGLRDELYGVIGFRKCVGFEFPETLKDRKITNPDAPVDGYCISVKADKRRLFVAPILFSSQEKYNRAHSEAFFDYLQTAFLAVARDMGPGREPSPLNGGKPILYSEAELDGFYEQIGKNTDYTIHPEEILADNFTYLFFGITELESPEVVRKMEQVFEKARLR